MILRPIAQCSKNLNFRPLRKWPEVLPAVSWQGHLLVAFERLDGEAVELGEQDFWPLLKACHPQLGLGQLARLESCCRAAGLPTAELPNTYGLRPQPALFEVFEGLRRHSAQVQDWVDQKQFGFKELALLPSLIATGSDTQLETLAARNLSRNIASQIFELSAELILMKRPQPSATDPAQDPDGRLWLSQLWQARNPLTSSIDRERRDRVEKLPWPNQIQGEWQRRGDRGQVEVRLSAASLQEWQRRIRDLEKLSLAVEKNPPWNS